MWQEMEKNDTALPERDNRARTLSVPLFLIWAWPLPLGPRISRFADVILCFCSRFQVIAIIFHPRAHFSEGQGFGQRNLIFN
jgi:hypothetical protein